MLMAIIKVIKTIIKVIVSQTNIKNDVLFYLITMFLHEKLRLSTDIFSYVDKIVVTVHVSSETSLILFDLKVKFSKRVLTVAREIYPAFPIAVKILLLSLSRVVKMMLTWMISVVYLGYSNTTISSMWIGCFCNGITKRFRIKKIQTNLTYQNSTTTC